MQALAGTTLPAACEWWRSEQAVQRFVCDLIAAELAALRPSGDFTPPSMWSPSLHLTRKLGVDSLELLGIASALAEAVHLHESGIEDYLLVRPTIAEWVGIVQAGLGRYSATLSFRTSGSTGKAKRCQHPLSGLWQEVEELAPLFGGSRRILAAVPAHHIYGFLFTVLLPRALGLAEVPIVDLRASSPARLMQELREGDLVVAHPQYWQLLVRAGSSQAMMPAGAVGVSSTAPCPDAVADALLQMGIAKLVQIYGSSETAGVGWREHAADPYRLLSYWRRDGGAPNELLRELADGQPARHACQDSLAWVDERRFRPTGRIDAAVQVGGANVFPSKVRDALLRHPAVRDAAVRLMRPDEGSRLKAFIVPHAADPDPDLQTLDALHASLEAWVHAELMPAERPRAFSFGPQLPKSANGKNTDWIIAPRDEEI